MYKALCVCSLCPPRHVPTSVHGAPSERQTWEAQRGATPSVLRVQRAGGPGRSSWRRPKMPSPDVQCPPLRTCWRERWGGRTWRR